jgi:hypothetical protein
MDSGAPPEGDEARALSMRWMTMLVRDTTGDPRLLAKLNLMHDNEPSMQMQVGISTQLRDYVLRAFSETKLLIYEKYLSPEEIRFMRANYGTRAMEWPQLMADVRDAIDAGVGPQRQLDWRRKDLAGQIHSRRNVIRGCECRTPLRMITDETDDAFEARAQGFYFAALKGDPKQAARFVHFPLRVNWSATHHEMIGSANQLAANWNRIFTPKYLAALRDAVPHDMPVIKSQYAMLGAGLAFFTDKGVEVLNAQR